MQILYNDNMKRINKRPDVIITTDGEVDDMNSLLHLALFLNEINLKGIIYTSSQYHFNGDGIHTLKEITPHYRTKGMAAYDGTKEVISGNREAGNLKEYRPMPVGWIESIWDNEYRAVYPYLKKHSEYFPSPEYLLSITRYGNIAFEGDVTEDTEGSDMIKEALLNLEQKLYLLSWGGANTIVRALMSIYDEYHDTSDWADLYKNICDNVELYGIVDGIGQDHSWQDHGISIFPDLRILRTEYPYGPYFASKTMQADCIDMFQAEWLKKNIKFGHGPLMSKYYLFGDGSYYYGEPEANQYGLHTVIDWSRQGIPVTYFEPYEFLGEGDSSTYVQLFDVGLRGLHNYEYGTLLGKIYPDGEKREIPADNPFIKGYQEEWAARTQWCHEEYEKCVHPPVVTVKDDDLYCLPGEEVLLKADVQGEDLQISWEYHPHYSSYHGKYSALLKDDVFTIPEDARSNDWFSVIVRVVSGKEYHITRYGQIIIHVN